MADDQHYDVVIIGTGAGGGTLGHRLAASGRRVLWLERGRFLPRERDNWETQVEHLYPLHGEDLSEGPPSAHYAFPPVSHEPRIQQLSDDRRRSGYPRFTCRSESTSRRRNRGGPPGRMSASVARVDGFPCLLDGKSDAQVSCVDPVLSRDNVTLMTGAPVQRLETDSSGRTVTGVVTDIVVVACGAVSSAALLMRSRGDHLIERLG